MVLVDRAMRGQIAETFGGWSVSLYSGKARAKGLANICQLVTIARWKIWI